MSKTTDDLKNIIDKIRAETWADDIARKGVMQGLAIARRLLLDRGASDMSLYHVTRRGMPLRGIPDETRALVVRASSQERARDIAMTHPGVTKDNVVVELLDLAGAEGVIVEDFYAG